MLLFSTIVKYYNMLLLQPHHVLHSIAPPCCLYAPRFEALQPPSVHLVSRHLVMQRAQTQILKSVGTIVASCCVPTIRTNPTEAFWRLKGQLLWWHSNHRNFIIYCYHYYNASNDFVLADNGRIGIERKQRHEESAGHYRRTVTVSVRAVIFFFFLA